VTQLPIHMDAGAVGDGFILMDDNARPHRARVVTDYLENEVVHRT
jgi:hypothetical protein